MRLQLKTTPVYALQAQHLLVKTLYRAVSGLGNQQYRASCLAGYGFTDITEQVQIDHAVAVAPHDYHIRFDTVRIGKYHIDRVAFPAGSGARNPTPLPGCAISTGDAQLLRIAYAVNHQAHDIDARFQPCRGPQKHAPHAL